MLGFPFAIRDFSTRYRRFQIENFPRRPEGPIDYVRSPRERPPGGVRLPLPRACAIDCFLHGERNIARLSLFRKKMFTTDNTRHVLYDIGALRLVVIPGGLKV